MISDITALAWHKVQLGECYVGIPDSDELGRELWKGTALLKIGSVQ